MSLLNARNKGLKSTLLLALVITSTVALVLLSVELGIIRAPMGPSSQLSLPNGYENISPSEAKEMMESGQKIILLDVRTPAEYASGHIAGAVLYPLQELENKIPDFDKNENIIVYCGTGARSAKASRILSDNGFKRVCNLIGGLGAWENAGFHVIDNSCQTCNQSATLSLQENIDDNGRGLGLIIENRENVVKKVLMFGAMETAPPTAFNWRDSGVVTSVKSQGGCGSCVAFGVIGAFEADIEVKYGLVPNLDLSEAHLFFCGGGTCSNGWSISAALNYLVNYGTPDESCFPYHSYDMPCSDTCPDWQVRARKISSWAWVAQDITSIKSALIQYGPLVAGFDVYTDFYSHYSGGVYHYDGHSAYLGGHCVTLVGYSDSENYWICKNSWGASWGENGYFRIGYGQCGIERYVAYVVVSTFPSVSVSISPSSQSGTTGASLSYTVTVSNTGSVSDNYSLTVSDNTGWYPSVSPTSLTVSAGSHGNATLSVTVPPSAMSGTIDKMIVTANGTGVSASSSCTAQVSVPIVRSVSVSISPSPPAYLENDNGRPVTFTVTVNNAGNVLENFLLTKGDNAGWTLSLDNNWLLIPNGGTRTTKLTVNIPASATGGTFDNIWVKATSRDNSAIFDNKSCLAHVKVFVVVRSLSVSITPSSKSGLNGDNLTYTVTVTNTGNVTDNYGLTVSDNAVPGWTPTVSPTSLLNVSPAENRVATLSVTIPSGTVVGNVDNMRVTATSKGDNTVSSLGSCTAQVVPEAVRGVSVSISPSSRSGVNGATLTYTVTVNNTGSVSDNYSLTTTDNSGWSPIVSPTSLTVSPGSNGNATLSVTVPSDAMGGTRDNMRVTASGTGDNASSTCTAQVIVFRSAIVSISPSSQENENGRPVTFTVTVNNTGNIIENFQLTKGDNVGWTLSLDNNWLLVSKGGTGTTKLTVNIPPSAIPGTFDNIWIKAASKDNALIFDNESCLARVKVFVVVRSVQVVISPSPPAYLENDNGRPVAFTVSVNNLGNVIENFQLTKGDNAGWTLSFDNTWLLIQNGGTRTTKLTVNIPASATGGTFDNIWVKATSKDNSVVFDNKSCLAHVKVAVVRSVSVSISPSSQSGANGATLNYTVTVNNTGSVSDNYSLMVSDNAGWSPSISPSSLTVSSGSSGSVTLRVTVPSGAIEGTIDRVTVTANGTGVSSSSSCTAQVTSPPPPPPSPPPTPPPSPSPVDTTPPTTPSIVSPTDSASITDNTPTLDWSEVSDPSGVTYDLSIARDAGFASIVLLKTGLTAYSYTLTPAEAVGAGTYYWRVRAIDGAGNASSWSENWSFTVSIAPSTPSLPSSRIPLITSEIPALVEVENEVVTDLKISVLRTVENVGITIQGLVDRPAEIAIAAPGKIYCYLEIIRENIAENNISSVTINFRVEKAWITAQVIGENIITLEHYIPENGGWTALPTVKVEEDATYVYFSATSPGLSYFAVSGMIMAPAAFTISSLAISPSLVAIGKQVSISATVRNTGDSVGTCTVTLKINGAVETIENITLAGGATEPIVFTVSRDLEGTYSVEINGLTGTFSVIAPSQPSPPPLGSSWIIFIVLSAAIVVTASALYLRRRRSNFTIQE